MSYARGRSGGWSCLSECVNVDFARQESSPRRHCRTPNALGRTCRPNTGKDVRWNIAECCVPRLASFPWYWRKRTPARGKVEASSQGSKRITVWSICERQGVRQRGRGQGGMGRVHSTHINSVFNYLQGSKRPNKIYSAVRFKHPGTFASCFCVCVHVTERLFSLYLENWIITTFRRFGEHRTWAGRADMYVCVCVCV